MKRFQYWMIDRIIDRKLGGPLNQFRGELHLPPVRGVMNQWWHSPQLALCLFPEWFAPRQPDWPAHITYTGFPLWDETGVSSMGREVEEFLQSGTPPLVFTPGSAMLHGQKFFVAAVEACQQLGRRGILLTRYPQQLPSSLTENVRHFAFVPLSQLLPRSAAIIHHAGAGTIGQGLAAGVPHLSMPLAHDQHDNAARLERLGVGATIEPSKFTGPNVADSLAKLLASPSVLPQCQALANRILSVDALSLSCDALERLSNTGVAATGPAIDTVRS
jgi:UDP:flavonoid glycosyltransferase YjiC (YdhE family)